MIATRAELLTDEPVPIAAICRRLRKHRGTVLRWIKKGIDGHRLEGRVIGGRWSTTWAALGDFLANVERRKRLAFGG